PRSGSPPSPYTTLFRSQLSRIAAAHVQLAEAGDVDDPDPLAHRPHLVGRGGVGAGALPLAQVHHLRPEPPVRLLDRGDPLRLVQDRKSTRLNSSHEWIS